jgi:hypothetical protein
VFIVCFGLLWVALGCFGKYLFCISLRPVVVYEDKLETSRGQFLLFLEHFYSRVAKQLDKCPDFYKK